MHGDPRYPISTTPIISIIQIMKTKDETTDRKSATALTTCASFRNAELSSFAGFPEDMVEKLFISMSMTFMQVSCASVSLTMLVPFPVGKKTVRMGVMAKICSKIVLERALPWW